MTYQLFADESGNKGHSRHFVMAGLIAHSDAWKQFSNEWAECLKNAPTIKIFKMKEAASCSGQFYGFTEKDRDAKLKLLVGIINKYVSVCTFTVIDLEAHAETWAKTNQKPLNDPYFWPFQNTIMAACFSLWDAGVRNKFEAIFDEQYVSGLRAKAYYPIMVEIAKHREPDASSILPSEPTFKTDIEQLPIQAADLFAWCIRKSTDSPEYKKFEWLLSEMTKVKQSEYAQYYDRERMDSVWQESLKLLADKQAPNNLIKLFKKIKSGNKNRNKAQIS
jgi:Protein of unknown function (DUF3800)